MKTIQSLLLIGLLSISLPSSGLQAQDFDTNRMNRDIRIMENILGEVFKTQIVTKTEKTVIINGYSLLNQHVRGTYLPGFGIIFMVPAYNMMGPRMQVENGYSFYYSTDDNGGNREVDEESIKARISEFLADYGSTISQLKENDHVMVIYGANQRNNSRFFSVKINSEDFDEPEDIPVISISATVKDMKAFRTGKIDSDTFENRLNESSGNKDDYLDLKVMGNIFETALSTREDEGFKISGGINYMMLENFGAIFSFNVRYSDDHRGFFRGANEAGRLLQVLEEQRMRMSRGQGAASAPASDQLAEIVQEEPEEDQQLNKVINLYEELKLNMKEYIIDYGRTLSSVKSDQFVLTSVDVSAHFDELADRVDFQVKKSVLEQLDQGKISRDEALAQVIITEY